MSTRRNRASRSQKEGVCKVCRKKFTRNRPRQRKCTPCYLSHKFKCADCRKVYKRVGDVRVCSKCLPKVRAEFSNITPRLRRHKDGTIGDYKTDSLLSKIGGSTDRGRTIDVGVGAGSKHIILASELEKDEQRGDDELDKAYADNAQDIAEGGFVPFDVHPDKEDINPAEAVDIEVSDERWLSEAAIEDDRMMSHIGWFLYSPASVVCKQTGWHHKVVDKMRKQLRDECPEIVARAVAMESAKTIAEARCQQSARQRDLERFKEAKSIMGS